MAKFKLSGVQELLRELSKRADIPDDVKKNALMQGGEIIRSEMEMRAPKSKLKKKHLKDNIVVGDVDTEKWKVDVGPKKEFFYAHFLEFGTRKMSAKPFAYPAFVATKEASLKKIAEVLKSYVERG